MLKDSRIYKIFGALSVVLSLLLFFRGRIFGRLESSLPYYNQFFGIYRGIYRLITNPFVSSMAITMFFIGIVLLFTSALLPRDNQKDNSLAGKSFLIAGFIFFLLPILPFLPAMVQHGGISFTMAFIGGGDVGGMYILLAVLTSWIIATILLLLALYLFGRSKNTLGIIFSLIPLILMGANVGWSQYQASQVIKAVENRAKTANQAMQKLQGPVYQALMEYKSVNGQYPRTLDQLEPKYFSQEDKHKTLSGLTDPTPESLFLSLEIKSFQEGEDHLCGSLDFRDYSVNSANLEKCKKLPAVTEEDLAKQLSLTIFAQSLSDRAINYAGEGINYGDSASVSLGSEVRIIWQSSAESCEAIKPEKVYPSDQNAAPLKTGGQWYDLGQIPSHGEFTVIAKNNDQPAYQGNAFLTMIKIKCQNADGREVIKSLTLYAK